MSTEQFLLNQRLHTVQQHLVSTLKTLEHQSKKTVKISEKAHGDKARVRELCVMLKDAIRKASATDVSLSRRETQIRDLNALLETRMKEIHDLEYKLTKSTERENDMRTQMEQTQRVIESVNGNLKDMQQRYELHQRHLREKYEVEHQRVQELEKHLEERVKELAELRNVQSQTKEEYLQRIHEAENQRVSIEEKLQVEQNAHAESKRFLEHQIQTLSEQMDHVREQKLSSEASVDRLRQELQEQMDRHSEKYNQLVREHASEKESANRAHLDEVKRLHEQMMTLNTEFSTKLAEERTRYVLLQQEMTDTQRRGTSELDKLRSEAESRERHFRSNLDELKSKLSHSEQQTHETQRSSAVWKRENDAFRTQHEILQKRIEELSESAGSNQIQRILNEERLGSALDYLFMVQEKRRNERAMYHSLLKWSVWCGREQAIEANKRHLRQLMEGSSQTDEVQFESEKPSTGQKESQTVALLVADRKSQTDGEVFSRKEAENLMASRAGPALDTTPSSAPPLPPSQLHSQVCQNTTPKQPLNVPTVQDPVDIAGAEPKLAPPNIVMQSSPSHTVQQTTTTTTSPQQDSSSTKTPPPATDTQHDSPSQQSSPSMAETMLDLSHQIEEQGKEIQNAVNEFDQLLEQDLLDAPNMPEIEISQFRLFDKDSKKTNFPKLTEPLEIIEEKIYGEILPQQKGQSASAVPKGSPTYQQRRKQRMTFEYKSPSK